jgi:hypothetical protein
MDSPQRVYDTLGRYSDLAARGVLFSGYATLTAPVIYSTAAGTGGPLVWNQTTAGVNGKNIHPLMIGFASAVVTTVAGGLGIGWGTSTAPTTTTAIDLASNCLAGGTASAMLAYRVGTVSAACTGFMPFAEFHTGALTVDNTGLTWIDVGGIVVAGPGKFVTVASTATLTTLQVRVGMIWAEL